MVQQGTWYKVVDRNQLAQGDILNSIEIMVPPREYELDNQNLHHETITAIVLSKVILVDNESHLFIAPVKPFSQVVKECGYYRSEDGELAIKQGKIPGYHLLNRCEIDCYQSDYLVVDLRSIMSVPYQYLINCLKVKKERIQLQPPYFQELTSALEHFFKKLRLPFDISPFI